MRLIVCAAAPQHVVSERGVSVQLGASFYRPQSCFSRDLAVLSAVVHRQQRWEALQQQHQAQHALEGGGFAAAPPPPPPLHVLDLMAGSGIRSMRYLLQAGADFVLCNEGDLANRACLEANLSAAAGSVAAARSAAAGQEVEATSQPTSGGGKHWELQGSESIVVAGEGEEGVPVCLTHEEAVSLLARCRQERRFFDVIDSDSFGAAAHCVGAALDAVRHGGLVCLTSTSGTIAGGRDTASALALYGQHLAPMPFANEQGLRMLIGLAHREALARRLTVTPMWSLFSPHGPVFRAMLLVDRQRRPERGRKRGRQQTGGRQHHAGQAGEQHAAAAWGSQAGRQAGRQAGSPHLDPSYGYILHWPDSKESRWCAWGDMPAALLAAGAGGRSGGQQPLLSGPLWLGPLHCQWHLQMVAEEAAARGWVQPASLGMEAAGPSESAGGGSLGKGSNGGAGDAPVVPATKKGSIGSLQLLLELLLEEAAAEAEGGQPAAGAAALAGGEPQAAGEAAAAAGGVHTSGSRGLPPWHLKTSDVGRAGRLAGPPSRAALAAELRRRGFLAARSHVDPSALRTNASMAEAVAAAVEGLGIRSMRSEQAQE